MKKGRIFVYHLICFIVGSAGIVIYVFHRLTNIKGGAGLGAVIAMPVIILVYITAFAILCGISIGISFLVSYFRNRRSK